MDDKDSKPNEGNGKPEEPNNASLGSRVTAQFDNPQAVRAWVSAVRPLVSELIESGRDAARPKRERVLSRWEALRRIKRAARRLDELFAAADCGLR